jgi:UDP-N-acetylmuramoyl-tripeptide--D-alanyl-D-alanine ligase
MQKLDFFNSIIPLENKILNLNIGEVKIDSRKIEKNDIFVAIRGGNSYVKDVLKKGAALVFYDDPKVEINDKRAIYVEDSIDFLQEIAKKYRQTLNVKIIGITGSEGKTSTKDILYSILSERYRGKKTQGNYNNHIGVPLTVLQLDEKDEFLVLEMGMSELGEIRTLSEIAKPDYALITNIGDSHLEFLINRDNVFKAKTEIFEFVPPKNRVVYGDDFYFQNIEGIKIGEKEGNDIKISNFYQDKNGSKFNLDYSGEQMKIETNLYGEYNAINTALAIALALKIGVDPSLIIEKCKTLKLSGMRFERVEKDGKIFINDAYNASPIAMKVALETFDEIFQGEYKVAILGDMLELGENSLKLHENLIEVIDNLNLDEIYLVGKNMKFLYEKLDKSKYKRCLYFERVEEIKEKIDEIKEEAIIFLKASNGISLNKIIE